MEVKEELEPPDEVLSSPYSILKARPKPSPVPALAAKVGRIQEPQGDFFKLVYPPKMF